MLEQEPERFGPHEVGKKSLFYPEAEIVRPFMTTRGKYQKGYPRGAIVHFTAGRYGTGALSYGKEMGYCYFLIDFDGKVYQSFPLNEWGYHAGKSQYPGLGSGVSDDLVGIEVCCAGKVEKVLIENDTRFKAWFHKNPKEYFQEHEVRYCSAKDNIEVGWYHKYTEAQEESLQHLILWLHSNNPEVFSMDFVLGHDEVSPKRKNDPGGSLSWTMPAFRSKLKYMAGLIS